MTAPTEVLAPELMPARDSEGYAYHPDLDSMLEDGEEDDELPISLDKMRAAGFDAAFRLMEHERSEEHPEYVEYFENGGAASGWTPDSPGDDWRLVAVYDTECGPAAMFVRALSQAGAA